MGKSKEIPSTSSGYKIMDRGQVKFAKICEVCQRQFTWRKKWERNWDEITTCSKKCNSERRRRNRRLSRSGYNVNSSTSGIVISHEPEDKVSRKARKKEMKKQRRAKREGNAPPDFGTKKCATCSKPSHLLVRCRIDDTKIWKLVCGKCWKKWSRNLGLAWTTFSSI